MCATERKKYARAEDQAAEVASAKSRVLGKSA